MITVSATVNRDKSKIFHGYFDPKHPIAHTDPIVVIREIANTFVSRINGCIFFTETVAAHSDVVNKSCSAKIEYTFFTNPFFISGGTK